MKLPRSVCALAALALLAWSGGGALAAEPAAPTVPAAQPNSSSEAPAKSPPVILASLPPMPNVFGGKIALAEKALPILGESTDAAVEAALRGAKLLPCPACKGKGKVGRSEWVKPTGGALGKPILKTWEEDCPTCGTYKDVYDPRFGVRLIALVDRLAHLPRDKFFDGFRKSAAEGLAAALEVRDKTLATSVCKPVITEKINSDMDVIMDGKLKKVHTMTGVTMEPGPEKPFHVEGAAAVEPLWTRAAAQAPAGQAVLIIGTTGEKALAGGWVCMRIRPSGKSPEAIVVFDATQKDAVPEGRIVLGGLMIGRWVPAGPAATPAASPAAAAATASGAPAATAPLPVILAVVGSAGPK